MGLGHLKGVLIGTLHPVCQILYGDFLFGTVLPAGQLIYPLSVKLQLLHSCFQVFGCLVENFFLQGFTCLYHGCSGQIGSAGSIGTGVIGGYIRISPKYHDIIQLAAQTFGSHLGQRGVAARSHVGRTDNQVVKTVVVYLNSSACHIHPGYGGALHGHGQSHAAHL